MEKKFEIYVKSLLLIAISLLIFSCNDDLLEDDIMTQEELIDQSLEEKISQGDEITEQEAELLALRFLKQETKKNYKQFQRKSISKIKDYDDDLAVYVFNMQPGGFVLVSSNTRDIPIIAYCDEGEFVLNENSSDGLKAWMAEAIMINNKLESMAHPSIEIKNKWKKLTSKPNLKWVPGEGDETKEYSHSVSNQFGPLMQTLWHQYAPFNFYVPNKYPAGCGTIAMAQVMRYHEWPNNYDWAIMPNDPPPEDPIYFESGSIEMAKLVNDIWGDITITSSPNSSGSTLSGVRNSLISDYGYSSNAYIADYHYTQSKIEIMSNRPVIMDGAHTTYTTGWWFWEQDHYEDSHTWVCDGYKLEHDVYIYNPGTNYERTEIENRYEWLYMNWGWGSNNGNGWYYHGNVRNNGTIITLEDGSSVHPNYQYNRECIYGIIPESSGPK